MEEKSVQCIPAEWLRIVPFVGSADGDEKRQERSGASTTRHKHSGSG